MESSLALNNLLHRRDIWRGRRLEPVGETRTSGFAELDRQLIGGGWPLGGLVEISYPRLGSGEWQLLSGTLQHCADQEGYLVLVNPPAMLCASALVQMGVPLSRLLIIRTADKVDLLAAVLETLRADCAQMLLFWETRDALSYADLRKVQLAAAGSQAFCAMMSLGKQSSHSPAVLGVSLQAEMDGVGIHIRRQRGGPAGARVKVAWPEGWTLQPFDPDLLQQQGAAAKVLPFQAQG